MGNDFNEVSPKVIEVRVTGLRKKTVSLYEQLEFTQLFVSKLRTKSTINYAKIKF